MGKEPGRLQSIGSLRVRHDWGTNTALHWRRTKEPLDEGERRQWKSWLRTNIQKTKIMASGPITSWQIEGEKVETVTEFIFLGSKITVDSDFSHEIKRCLEESCDQLSTLKSKGITLQKKFCRVKTTVFPVVMYGCELWTIKKAECWRTDAFKLWC